MSAKGEGNLKNRLIGLVKGKNLPEMVSPNSDSDRTREHVQVETSQWDQLHHIGK